MVMRARIFVALLVLAFAAGSVMQVAQATDITIKMSEMAPSAGAMADCDGCGDDGKDETTCSPDCVAPAMAVFAASKVLVRSAKDRVTFPPANVLVGRSGPPDPHPPRTLVLS